MFSHEKLRTKNKIISRVLSCLFVANAFRDKIVLVMSSNIQPILDKALAGERLTAEDATALLESYDIAKMGAAAHEIRIRKNPSDVVTYIIDRNINYTNVCNVVCTFCAFYRRPGKPETYVHSIEEIEKRIDETIALGGTGVLMQGGLHPDFNIEWYENLLSTLHAKYPTFQLHCFSPPEIHNISLISKLDYETILHRLKAAGLNSMPGGGGEILDDEVRRGWRRTRYSGFARGDQAR